MYLSFDEWCSKNEMAYNLIVDFDFGYYEQLYIEYCVENNLVSDLDEYLEEV